MLSPYGSGGGVVATNDSSPHGPQFPTEQLRAAETIARARHRAGLPDARARIDAARREARKLTKRFGVELASDVHVDGFAKQLGVDIAYARIDGADAQLVVGIGHACIYVSDRLVVSWRRRWAVAHELGHFVMKHPSPPPAALSEPTPSHDGSALTAHEIEANHFALELLMPACTVRAIKASGHVTLAGPSQLASACDVALELAVLRVIESTRHACAVALSSAGTIRWTSTSRRARILGDLRAANRLLDPGSLASRYFDGRRGSDRPALVPAASWLERPAEPFLLEHSLPGSQPGTVLTMLSAPRRRRAGG
jgi:Zn-dependent peptidase ImmA (M78 family)